MKFRKLKYQKGVKGRRSNRLKGYDYASKGLYFITMCAADKYPFWGEVKNGVMHLNEAGKIADRCWREIPRHFPHVGVISYVVMPDHVHGLIEIKTDAFANGVRGKWNCFAQFCSPSRTVGSVVRGYKIGVVKGMKSLGISKTVWQRNYHDSIVFNISNRHRIIGYIRNNPRKWVKA